MKELTLRELQEYSLKVLVHVHEFCVAHHIDYTLAYGTLIGAVRHKGFIPWDDDVDIIMTRDNFERFVNEYQSDDDFKLVSPYDHNSYIAFARVCDMKETLVVTHQPWSAYQTGVWIDIFPMDNIDDDYLKHLARHKKLYQAWAGVHTYRSVFFSYKKKLNFDAIDDDIRLFVKKRLWANDAQKRLRQRMDDFLKEIKSPDYAHSSHCAQIAYPDEFGFYEKKDFEEFTTLEFEGHQLMAVKAYDKVLRQLYGEYMQFPPLAQMTPPQASYIHFYHR